MDMSLVCCNVSSPSVKRLRLFLEFSGFVSLEYSDGYRVELNTPALKDLVLEDGSYEHIQSGPLPCLIKADITFTNYRYCASILKFVNRLSNIEYLKLYLAHYGEDLHWVFSASSISFRNLTKLELTADCRMLSILLESANNLQFLIFEMVDVWVEPQRWLPTCLLTHLRSITLFEIWSGRRGLCGERKRFEIVRYLLRNGRVSPRETGFYAQGDITI